MLLSLSLPLPQPSCLHKQTVLGCLCFPEIRIELVFKFKDTEVSSLQSERGRQGYDESEALFPSEHEGEEKGGGRFRPAQAGRNGLRGRKEACGRGIKGGDLMTEKKREGPSFL